MLRPPSRQSASGASMTRWSAKVAENAKLHCKVEEELPFCKYLQHGLKLSLRWTEDLHERISSPKQLYVRVSNESGQDRQHQDRVMRNELDIINVLSGLTNIPDLLFVGSMGDASLAKAVAIAIKSGCCSPKGIKIGCSDELIISIVDGTGRPLRSLGLHEKKAKHALRRAFVLCFGVRELLLHGVVPTNLSPNTVLWHPAKRQFVFLGLGQAIYVGSRHEQAPCSISTFLKAVHEAADNLPMQSLLDLGVALPHGNLPSSFAPEVQRAHTAAMREDASTTGSCLGMNVAYQLGGLLYFVATGMECFTNESHGTAPVGSERTQAAAGASTRAAATPGIAAAPLPDLDRAPEVVRGLIKGLLHPDPKKRTSVLEATDFLGVLLWQKHRGTGHDRPYARASSFRQGKTQPAKGNPTATSQPMSCPAQFRLPHRTSGAHGSETEGGQSLASFAGAGAGPRVGTKKPSSPVARGPSVMQAASDAVAGASSSESSAARRGRQPSSGAGDDVVVSPLDQASRGGPGAARQSTEPDEAPVMVRGASTLSVTTVADDSAGSSTQLIREASVDTVRRQRSGSLPSEAELLALREHTQRRISGRPPDLSLSTGSENADFDAHVSMQSDIRTRASTVMSQDSQDIHRQPESPGLSTGSPRMQHTPHQATTRMSTICDGRRESSHEPAPHESIQAGNLAGSEYLVEAGSGGAHGHLHALERQDELPAAGEPISAREVLEQPAESARSPPGIHESLTGSLATQLKQVSQGDIISPSSSCQPAGESSDAASDVSKSVDTAFAMLSEGYEPIGATGSAPDTTLTTGEAVSPGPQASQLPSPSRASALESTASSKTAKAVAQIRLGMDMLETLEWERVSMRAGSSTALTHREEADSQSAGALAADSPAADESWRFTGTDDAGTFPGDNNNSHGDPNTAAGSPTISGAGEAIWGVATLDGWGTPRGDEAELEEIAVAPSWPRSSLRHDHPQAVAIQGILSGAARQSSVVSSGDDSVRHWTDPASVEGSSPVEIDEDGLPRLPTLVRADSGTLGAEDNPGLLVSAAAWMAPGLGIGTGPRRLNSSSFASIGSEVGLAGTSTVDLNSPVASRAGEAGPTPRADSPGSGLRIRANHHRQPQHATRRQLSPRAELLYAGDLQDMDQWQQSKRSEGSQSPSHGVSGAGDQATHEAAGSPAPRSSPSGAAVGSVAGQGSDGRSERESGGGDGRASQRRGLLDPIDPTKQISIGGNPSSRGSGRDGCQSRPPRREPSRLGPRRAAPPMDRQSEPEPEPESRAESASQGGNHPLTVDAFLGPSHHGLLSPREPPAQHVPSQSQFPRPELSISVPGQARALRAAPGAPELAQSPSGGSDADADADAQEWDAIDAGSDAAMVVLPGRILALLLGAPGSESIVDEDSRESSDDFERE